MVDTFHRLWPTLIYETHIQVDNLPAFNARLLESVIAVTKDPSINFWEMDTPELQVLKSEFKRATRSWLVEAGLVDTFEQVNEYGWLNVYQPEQFIPPHHHQNLELITLYYLTDEPDGVQFRTISPPQQAYTGENIPGSTVLMDPRGALEFRETSPTVEFVPRQGRMLTTPGHIVHWTTPTPNLRAIIVSNPKFKRKSV